MSETLTRGRERETALDADVYYSEHYFSLTQLLSQAQQIYEIHKIRPKSILEIGPGNGFTSLFLKRAGYDVVTVDINPALKPDICAPLDDLSRHLDGRRFDLVVCCEVLEHMPWEEFRGNLQHLHSAGDRLFMTLPNYKRSFGLGAILRFPKLGSIPFRAYANLGIPKTLPPMHFWEVGSGVHCTKSAIVTELKRIYKSVNTGQFTFNPYHLSFYAR